MLVLFLAVVLLFDVFLLGALVIASVIAAKHGDLSASYRLFAVRDGLIAAVVFGGVRRDDPWFSALYENVNNVLRYSNFLSGPRRWPLAICVGSHQGSCGEPGKGLVPLPSDVQCPERLQATRVDLCRALTHLLENHLGIFLQTDARDRARRRVQKEEARKLLQMMGEHDRQVVAT